MASLAPSALQLPVARLSRRPWSHAERRLEDPGDDEAGKPAESHYTFGSDLCMFYLFIYLSYKRQKKK